MKQTGFSMLEILIVFSIILILLTLTLPSQKSLLENTSTDIIRHRLLSAIHYAQVTAESSKKIITLCPSTDEHTCSARWQDTYILIADKKIIYTFNNLAYRGQLNWRSFPFDQPRIDYLPSGMLKTENGTFWYCMPGEKNPRWAIVLSQSGRAKELEPQRRGDLIKNGERMISC